MVRLGSYFHTLRQLLPGQLFWLLRYRFARGSARRPSVQDAQPLGCAYSTAFILPSALQTMEQGVSFLNSEQTFGSGLPDWQVTDKPKLWRYNLQYFDYLLWSSVAAERKVALMGSWIGQNPLGSVDAWEPYPVSLRIVNWIKFMLLPGSTRGVPAAWSQSLALQAAWLEANLENHILANHYLKNAKALVFAGLFFRGPAADRWLKVGAGILGEQVGEQFLADGGHYELSPMYHCICLEDLLDVWNLANACDGRVAQELVARLAEVARRGLDFLASILGPNGDIPLFNDSAFGIAPSSDALFDYAQRLFGYQRPECLQQALPDSGYFRLGGHEDLMIVDCGPVSPAYQPGHTHCDMLSYELALDRVPIVVDTGVYDYEDSDERAYCRSTRAHNTVSVDGEDQSELWGVFRVARRAQPCLAELVSNGHDGARFVGAIAGFPRVTGGIHHRREISYDRKHGWTVRDQVSGLGRHEVDSWIHLHPELSVRTAHRRLVIVNRIGVALACIRPLTGAPFKLETGWYFPRFGVKQRNQVLRLTAAGDLPISLAYRIQKVEPESGR